MRAGPLTTALLAASLAITGSACATPAETVPTFLVKARYRDARAALLNQGWQPSPGSDDPDRCARGFERQCAAYPETEYCAGGGLPRCVFLWRDAGGMLIELRTLGRDEPVVEIVRCRLNCRTQRPERASWPVADSDPPPEPPPPYLRG